MPINVKSIKCMSNREMIEMISKTLQLLHKFKLEKNGLLDQGKTGYEIKIWVEFIELFDDA